MEWRDEGEGPAETEDQEEMRRCRCRCGTCDGVLLDGYLLLATFTYRVRSATVVTRHDTARRLHGYILMLYFALEQ